MNIVCIYYEEENYVSILRDQKIYISDESKPDLHLHTTHRASLGEKQDA